MKPKDILPDEINAVEKDGVIVRKGTLGAFSENIRIIENSNEDSSAFKEAVADLLELIPALLKLNFFEFYSLKSQRVKAIIRTKYPDLNLD